MCFVILTEKKKKELTPFKGPKAPYVNACNGIGLVPGGNSGVTEAI